MSQPTDPNQRAKRLADAAKSDANPPRKKNLAAVALGRKGGLKGGVARAKVLTKDQRSEIAKKAAQKRWGTKRKTAR